MASKTKDNEQIVYVTRDIERALGKKPSSNYLIITNTTPYSQKIKEEYPDQVVLINSDHILDTIELLKNQTVLGLVASENVNVVVFKNTKHIEDICTQKGINLLNPRSQISEKIENKITQVEWLDELSSLLPEHRIEETKNIKWGEESFVLQWAHGHTGDGTILIQDEKILEELKSKFPERKARITKYIKGPMFTLNTVVFNDNILLGNISYQITGALPFTENIFSTIGNDWSVPQTILSESQIEQIKEMAKKIGKKMQNSEWHGLFGIDVIYDEERDSLHLIEINARQPASTTFESELQEEIRSQGIMGITTFDAHLSALLGKKSDENIIEINDGAQILQRVTSIINKVDTSKLTDAGYKIIEYNNIKINSDLVRIQSKKGIMETHTKFNKRGKEIIELLD